MKPLFWLGIVIALNFNAVPLALARMAIETPSAKGDGLAVPQGRKSGVIGQVDLGDGTMEVGGVKYLYSPSLTRVSHKNAKSTQETLNPLSLRVGSQIEFLTKKEGAKERITDIWLTGGKQ